MVDHARAARMAKRIQQIVATAIEREIRATVGVRYRHRRTNDRGSARCHSVLYRARQESGG